MARKPVFGVYNQVRHKPGCTATVDGYRLEISNLEVEGVYYLTVAKTTVLISCAVTVQLICVLVFTYMYTKNRVLHDTTQFISVIFLHLVKAKTTLNQYFAFIEV